MRRSTAYTVVAAILWGTSFPAIRVGLDQGGAGPFAFAFLRFLLAALILAALLVARGRWDWTFLRSKWIWGLGAVNAVGYALQFVAQQFTTASKTSLLVDIDVVAIAILGYFFLRERHGKEVVVALALGLIGVVLLATNGDWRAAAFTRPEFAGDVLAFAAGLVWAVYFVGIKAFLDRRPDVDGLAVTGVLLALTALFLAPPAVAFDGIQGIGGPVAWGLIAYLAVLPTALAFYLWQAALRTESVTATSVILLLEIVVAVVIGVAFLDERFTTWSLAGGVLVVVAAALAGLGGSPGKGAQATTDPERA